MSSSSSFESIARHSFSSAHVLPLHSCTLCPYSDRQVKFSNNWIVLLFKLDNRSQFINRLRYWLGNYTFQPKTDELSRAHWQMFLLWLFFSLRDYYASRISFSLFFPPFLTHKYKDEWRRKKGIIHLQWKGASCWLIVVKGSIRKKRRRKKLALHIPTHKTEMEKVCTPLFPTCYLDWNPFIFDIGWRPNPPSCYLSAPRLGKTFDTRGNNNKGRRNTLRDR